jgi:hypothetical protein
LKWRKDSKSPYSTLVHDSERGAKMSAFGRLRAGAEDVQIVDENDRVLFSDQAVRDLWKTEGA